MQTAVALPVRQRTPEWHAARRNGIGSSDIAVIAGESPYRSAYELWAEKAGLAPSTEPDPEQADRVNTGYGVAFDGEIATSAHRVIYELVFGQVPDELEVDHLCRTRVCVNPRHLEAVTPQVNQRRSLSVSGLNARKLACPRGHTYSGTDASGRRICHPCQAERQRRYRERVAMAVPA